ncbi:hypothetical protein [Nitrospira sp. Nam80]|jgi:tetrahydromethanopterin S-methyltransferase subunit A
MAEKKILEVIPKELIQKYDLNVPTLRDVSVSDINNLNEAIQELEVKGTKPRGVMCCTGMCCTGMCCTAR